MKKIFILMIMSFVAMSSLADGMYYGFLVELDSPHTLIKDIKNMAVNQTPKSEFRKYKKDVVAFVMVNEAVYNAGYNALSQPTKDAYVDALKDEESEADNSSIDAQALIDVIAELTGTPVGQVKSKFKAAKKDKEKNK